MSSNKIKKVNSAAVPSQLRAEYGPGTAGIDYDDAIGAVEVNPSGTRIQLANVVVSASTAPVTQQYATGTIWVKQDNDKVYVNTGTLTTPNWQILN